MGTTIVKVNRAPVLTLWAAVVAQRLGQDPDAALTLGKAVAGLNAQAKGQRLGIYTKAEPTQGSEPKKAEPSAALWIDVCGRPVPARKTEAGLRAVIKDAVIEPEPVRRYLDKAFGGDLGSVRAAMEHLAGSFSASELGTRAYGLYERFRPSIESGTRGWGQKGDLDLGLIRSLASRK